MAKQEECDKLRAKLVKLNAEWQERQKKSDEAKESMQLTLEQKEHDIVELNQAITGYKDFFQAQEDLQKEEEAERERLRKECNAQKESLDKWTKLYHEERDAHNECQKDLATMDEHAHDLETQMAQAKAYFKKLSAEQSSLEVKVSAYGSRIRELEKEKEELTEARIKMQNELATAIANVDQLQVYKRAQERSQKTRHDAIDNAGTELDMLIGQYKKPLALSAAGSEDEDQADGEPTETKIPDFLLS
eukprot:2548574-Pyramimonas_sp.AAC.1